MRSEGKKKFDKIVEKIICFKFFFKKFELVKIGKKKIIMKVVYWRGRLMKVFVFCNDEGLRGINKKIF